MRIAAPTFTGVDFQVPIGTDREADAKACHSGCLILQVEEGGLQALSCCLFVLRRIMFL